MNKHRGVTWNWPYMSPMPGFHISTDYGKTWKPSPLTPEQPLFPEPAKFLGPVKMGAPHFVDFEFQPGLQRVENEAQPAWRTRHLAPAGNGIDHRQSRHGALIAIPVENQRYPLNSCSSPPDPQAP